MKYPRKTKNFISPINNASGQIGIIVSLFLLAAFSIVVGQFISAKSLPLLMAIIGGAVVILVTLVNTDFAIVILILSMLLSPEIPIAQVPERSVVLRVDDILIFAVFFTWLAKMAINKELALFKRTPLNLPILIFIFANVISTFLGVFDGNVKFKQAIFYLLKYCEYFMLYFLAVNNLNSREKLKLYILAIFVTSFFVLVYALPQIGGDARPTAPFEGQHPEPNTLAGYLLIILSLIMAFLIHSQKLTLSLLLSGLGFFLFALSLFTLSRSGYVGVMVAYACFMLVSKKKKMYLAVILLLCIFILPLLLPDVVVRRVRDTFAGHREFAVGARTVHLEESAAIRVYNWRYALQRFKERPLFGYGVTGVGLIDSQYPRIIAELGIVGMLSFIWLMWKLFVSAMSSYKQSRDALSNSVSLGFLASFFGLLSMGIGVSIFVIVRISEPFWFLAGCVMMLPFLENDKVREGREIAAEGIG